MLIYNIFILLFITYNLGLIFDEDRILYALAESLGQFGNLVGPSQNIRYLFPMLEVLCSVEDLDVGERV